MADAPAMADVAEQAYAPYVERMHGVRPAPMDADYAGLVRDGDAWVAEDEGEVVGFLTLVPERAAMHLDGVAVRPSYHGAGAGRLLLTLAEERARAAGHGRIWLYTNEAMVESQRLYERIGYVETHRAEQDGYRRIFYEKELG